MVSLDNPQEIFEQFLRSELTLAAAADALIELLGVHKGSDGPRPSLALRKPETYSISATDLQRIDALLAEIDRRLAGP